VVSLLADYGVVPPVKMTVLALARVNNFIATLTEVG
jgi:hypothetical protein